MDAFTKGFIKAAEAQGMKLEQIEKMSKTAGLQDILAMLKQQGGNAMSGASGMFDKARSGVQNFARPIMNHRNNKATVSNMNAEMQANPNGSNTMGLAGQRNRILEEMMQRNQNVDKLWLGGGALAGAGMMGHRMFGGGQPQPQEQQIPEHSQDPFKFGFIKAATDKGFSKEDAEALYKLSAEDGPYSLDQASGYEAANSRVKGLEHNRHEHPGHYWANPAVGGPMTELLERFKRRMYAAGSGKGGFVRQQVLGPLGGGQKQQNTAHELFQKYLGDRQQS